MEPIGRALRRVWSGAPFSDLRRICESVGAASGTGKDTPSPSSRFSERPRVPLCDPDARVEYRMCSLIDFEARL
jgi:hypothetical protein